MQKYNCTSAFLEYMQQLHTNTEKIKHITQPQWKTKGNKWWLHRQLLYESRDLRSSYPVWMGKTMNLHVVRFGCTAVFLCLASCWWFLLHSLSITTVHLCMFVHITTVFFVITKLSTWSNVDIISGVLMETMEGSDPRKSGMTTLRFMEEVWGSHRRGRPNILKLENRKSPQTTHDKKTPPGEKQVLQRYNSEPQVVNQLTKYFSCPTWYLWSQQILHMA